MLTGILAADQGSFFASMWFGFLVMLVAMTFMFVGVKRYRDIEHGGIIRFKPAFLMGLAIAAVAALAYILVWEAYLAATGYRFMDDYLAGNRPRPEGPRERAPPRSAARWLNMSG
jgi:hypothetical protein